MLFEGVAKGQNFQERCKDPFTLNDSFDEMLSTSKNKYNIRMMDCKRERLEVATYLVSIWKQERVAKQDLL